ncbi:T9SS type A sorting domain-containing protein [Aequorivita sp. F47161]|uniref:T9SS type A sorting domain-containing protein n=1 Tax=Aequorivita vitellina TaxID=2874475 RepID=A0A9X1QVY9_9FLAO|nr:T9SS type A sorting domain-containing protein [Aequorivita vitellina]MCG2418123.1 T9SS type A sorting domain-containing protein [Aequorivita vitellina]MCZ4318007.1 T9SS type A sorting domain-containing protein [Aequorivita viscosa]
MKKITLMMFALATSFAVSAQEMVLTQTSGAITDAGVACGDSGAGTTGDNYYMRSYNLAEGGVTGNVSLTGIEFYVGSATGTTGLEVMIFDEVAFPTGFDVTNLPTPLATGEITVDSGMIGTLVRAEFDTPAAANQDSNIVAVIFEADGQTTAFYLGTAETETYTSYLASVACSLNSPTPVADIGFPDSKHVIDLVIDDALSVGENLADKVAIYPSPATDVLNVKLPSNVVVESSSLVSILGKTTGVTLSNGVMNVSGIAPGVYFLNLVTNMGTYTQKVIKQ